MTPLNREDRITIAVSMFGLYTLGMATTESEKVDEDCAMDNMGVPYYEELMNEEHRQILARHEFYRDFVGPPTQDEWHVDFSQLFVMFEPPTVEQIKEALKD